MSFLKRVHAKKPRHTNMYLGFKKVYFGGDERIRTAVEGFADPCLATRPRRPEMLVRPTGLEPVTYGLADHVYFRTNSTLRKVYCVAAWTLSSPYDFDFKPLRRSPYSLYTRPFPQKVGIAWLGITLLFRFK